MPEEAALYRTPLVELGAAVTRRLANLEDLHLVRPLGARTGELPAPLHWAADADGESLLVAFFPASVNRGARQTIVANAEALTLRGIDELPPLHFCCDAEDGRFVVAWAVEQGPTLRDQLDRGRLSAREALEVGIDVAGSLETIHNAGLAHGALAPATVLRRRTGGASLLAACVRRPHETAATEEPPPLAENWYDAASGRARTTAQLRAADLQQLGALLVEALTRSLPTRGGPDVQTQLDRLLDGSDAPSSLRRLLARLLSGGEQAPDATAVRSTLVRGLDEIQPRASSALGTLSRSSGLSAPTTPRRLTSSPGPTGGGGPINELQTRRQEWAREEPPSLITLLGLPILVFVALAAIFLAFWSLMR